MLPVQKNKELTEQIKRIFRRMEHIKQVKIQLYKFITEAEQLYSTFSQQINKQMIEFQYKIVKNSLYSTEKTAYIINLGKVYRQFSIQLQKNSKINILNLQRIKNEEIVKQQQKLLKVCNSFNNDYRKYIQDQLGFNAVFSQYSQKCVKLDQIIKKYSSYQDPLAFYNHNHTNSYITELDKNYNQCSSNEIIIINAVQGLDQTRKWLSEQIKEINENYVILLHIYLVIIQRIIYSIIEPKKQQNVPINKIGMRNSEDSGQQNHNLQLQKLTNLYSSELAQQQNCVQDNIIEQYSELFNKNFTQNELHSDYKFFYDRCENVRSKKIKTSEQIIKLQSLLIKELSIQKNNYKNFQANYRSIQKDIFTNNGIESFKKRFRKYFGSNFMQIQELCLIIIDRKKKSLEKIGKCMQDNEQKLQKLLQNKIQAMRMFQKRTKLILEDHLKIKQKAQKKESMDNQQMKGFKQSISQSFNELKKSFMQIQKSQSQIDKMFFKNLKIEYETIVKEAIGKNLIKILQKQKNRVNILNNLNVESEIVLILKEDSRYQMLLNQCPKPNLYATFQSLIKKKDFQQTKLLLQKKDQRLKTMSKQKKGCCGVTSQPIKLNVLSTHQCKLKANDKTYKGRLDIATVGLMFQENSWNPFANDLRITIPISDITNYDSKQINEKPWILIFQTKEAKEQAEILQSIGKNMVFKPVRQQSERGKNRNDSSSFLKQNTSTEFKLSYDKSLKVNSEILKVGPKGDKDKDKGKAKIKTHEVIMKQLVLKWKQSPFLNSSFTKVVKNGQQNNQNRRDYQYKSGHTKFFLKEKVLFKTEDKNLHVIYDWKISFPQSPMLHSFKYSQKIVVENIMKDLVIKIYPGKHDQQQLYIRSKFYKQIQEMTTLIWNFIVNTLQKEADIKTILPESDETKSLDSCNIVIDDINLEERESKFQRAQSTLRNSKLQRNNSNRNFNTSSSNGFKAN